MAELQVHAAVRDQGDLLAQHGLRQAEGGDIGAHQAAGFGGLNYPRNLDKPLISAVNGIACGGGFEIVLGTDIIVMEEHAKFALPEINVAVLADAADLVEIRHTLDQILNVKGD